MCVFLAIGSCESRHLRRISRLKGGEYEVRNYTAPASVDCVHDADQRQTLLHLAPKRRISVTAPSHRNVRQRHVAPTRHTR